MCKQDYKIRLCSCVHSNAKEYAIPYNDKDSVLITWTLKRFISETWTGLDGMLIEPSKSFTNKITAEYLCSEMNASNCFDFEYLPNHGDAIIFDLESKHKKKRRRKVAINGRKYISLIYKTNKWVIDVHNPFYILTHDIKQGVLKLFSIK